MCRVLCCICVCAPPAGACVVHLPPQPGITPYRAHAHKRYLSMNRVPEHDLGLELRLGLGLGLGFGLRLGLGLGLELRRRNAPNQNALVYISFCAAQNRLRDAPIPLHFVPCSTNKV